MKCKSIFCKNMFKHLVIPDIWMAIVENGFNWNGVGIETFQIRYHMTRHCIWHFPNSNPCPQNVPFWGIHGDENCFTKYILCGRNEGVEVGFGLLLNSIRPWSLKIQFVFIHHVECVRVHSEPKRSFVMILNKRPSK